MNRQKKYWVFFISFILLAIVFTALLYYYKTQTSWVESSPYARVGTEPARTLVVVYSRTGNTFGAAKEIARSQAA